MKQKIKYEVGNKGPRTIDEVERIIVKGTQEVMRSRAGHVESAAGKAGLRGRDWKRKRK